MKKRLLVVFMMMIMVFALCACGEKKEQNEPVKNQDVDIVVDNTEEEFQGYRPATQEEIDKLVVTLNESSFKIKEKFEDIKERMEDEIKPSQTYTPCGGSDDEQVTTHYYDGVTVEETHEGVIYNIVISGYEFPESKATIAGVKLGDTPETVKSIIGVEPETDSEYTINYTIGDIAVSFGLDFDGTGNVNYISLFDLSSGMV